MSKNMYAYQQAVQDIVVLLQTNRTMGLTDVQAAERIKKNGPNALPAKKSDSWLTIFIHQFQSPLIYILLAAAIIIFLLGSSRIDPFIITGILFFNAIIGTIQEGRTSSIVESLSSFITTKSVVIRDGKREIIDDIQLVVGDLIVLKEGERVPADARVIESSELMVDEAILTGESKPVLKIKDALTGDYQPADQINMVFRGTYISSGSGMAIVTAIGIATQIGKLHIAVETIQTDIPLKKEVNRLSYTILLIAFSMCLLLLIIGLIFGRSFRELMVMLTALFICVIPEGLPVVLTLVLVTGAYRMARQKVLIKNLQGVEALGRTDVIIIDKTGTLTRNEMMVRNVVTAQGSYEVTGEGYFTTGTLCKDNVTCVATDDQALEQIAIAGALMSDVELSYSQQYRMFEIKGDPTEAALLVFAAKLGYDKLTLFKEYSCVKHIPFDSARKYHADFFKKDNETIAYIIGAPEIVFARAGEIAPLISTELAHLLEQGLRVVAIGYKKITVEQLDQDAIAQGITILGLCAIQDAIRSEVKDIIAQARMAGLRVIMATGDHLQTANYVAHQVGIARQGDETMQGADLAQFTDAQLLEKLPTTTVFARVSPQDKVRIVNLFRAQGNIVAMTGDGINDVPALVAADLGIAMGRIGTQVTKQAADLVLLDDSFVNIIHAIEQGRHIFYTLRRVVLYFFATNMGEIFIILFALFTNLPLPLTAAQILWLNFVTDGFLDVGLSMEPQESDLLAAKWLKKKTRLVDANLLIKMIYFAIPMGVISLGMFWWCYDGPASLAYARTMTLVTMAMFQWFNAWNCRSERKSLFTIGFFTNRWLIGATLFVLSLQFALVYVPFLRYIFKTVPLSFADWGLIFALSAPLLAIEEGRKWLANKFLFFRDPID